jgi:hypothetical protein
VHLTLYLGDLARTPCNFQIKETLEIQPKLGIGVEVSCQAQRGLRRDSAPLVYHFSDPSIEMRILRGAKIPYSSALSAND